MSQCVICKSYIGSYCYHRQCKVCRTVYELICRAPFEEAIKSADITKDEIELVVPFGGASRIPKIQEQILSVTQKFVHFISIYILEDTRYNVAARQSIHCN